MTCGECRHGTRCITGNPDKTIACRRYPETILLRLGDPCGEFRPKESVAEEAVRRDEREACARIVEGHSSYGSDDIGKFLLRMAKEIRNQP